MENQSNSAIKTRLYQIFFIYLKNVHVHCFMVVRIHIVENDDGR